MGQTGPLRLLVGGGGTGGHIFIGIALAQEWKSRMAGNEVLFVGARGRLEERLLVPAGIPLQLLDVAQLKGVPPLCLLRNLMKLPGSLLRCLQITRSFRPHVAIGVGGYASGPVLLAATLLGTPSMIVEPNARPGLANRWLSRSIRLAAVAFPEARRYFGEKTRLTGIPVRREFFQACAPPPPGFTLLIFGGSQGSRAINAAAIEAIPRLREQIPDLRVIHQTGTAEFESCRRYGSAWWEVRPFIDDMPRAMSQASLVICRAGASTLAELAAAGKCAVLVPFPFAADDHQMVNARCLASQGAARLLPQSELTAGALANSVLELHRRPEQRKEMESAIRRFFNARSAEEIIDLAVGLMGANAA
ncbi:MAG: undecaprenyldiphospho-muramoylpentapeptide beta-N-acetylglucosaminyltransferase [Acidobacteria bacterium]|nr:undecaprenyldiphospho-muramoylpentapeptide beta-N-acetylglucosaminyltransferase [Acidobacteriota bacterium]